MRTRSQAFTFPEALVVICILVLVGMALLSPAMRNAKARSGRSTCVNNLKQISLAFKQWSLDSTDRYPMQVSVTNGGTMELVEEGRVFPHFLVMSNELNTPRVLICPGETDPKRLTATTFGNQPFLGQIPYTNDFNVSYFVGVDAEDVRPQMLLVGDSHFAIGGKRATPGLVRLGTNSPVGWPKPIRKSHDKGGNIGLADGSVINCNSKGFQDLLPNTGDPTNRLAIP